MTTTFPSAPKVLADALYQQFGVGSTQLPNDFAENLPAVQVRRIGGLDDGNFDTARIVVVVIAKSEEEAETLSEEIRSFLIDTRPIRGAGRLLDKAVTETAPLPVGFEDSAYPEGSEFQAVYLVSSRRS